VSTDAAAPGIGYDAAMHQVHIRQEIVDRVLARRRRLHLFDRLDPRATALVVIDMQHTFCAPGAPAEVPKARGLTENINRVAAGLRERGGTVAWVVHANAQADGRSDWDMFFDHFVAADVRQRTIESLDPAGSGQTLWTGLDAKSQDIRVIKNRYSALIRGSSPLEGILRERGIANLLIAGTKTNVCCEATGRDAMMLDFRVVMLSDCTAALSDDEHRATLETFIQQFGDVLTADEALAILR
jgi:ureidoacrylate peracid hydrolase